jgi:small subunit ribosomal protein S8
MRHDLLSDVLSAIKNGDHVGKTEVVVSSSKLAKEVLFKIALLGNINNCGTIRPRYSVRLQDYDKYKRRFLPAAGLGMLIVSTSQGLMTHLDSEQKAIGGKLLAFIY